MRWRWCSPRSRDFLMAQAMAVRTPVRVNPNPLKANWSS
jgi:hypothetical protein